MILILGLGNVSTIALVTDVTRATSKDERTPVLVFFNITQQVNKKTFEIKSLLQGPFLQIGLLLGPACNIFLREIDFEFYGFKINKLNVPGLFLALMYIIYEVAPKTNFNF